MPVADKAWSEREATKVTRSSRLDSSSLPRQLARCFLGMLLHCQCRLRCGPRKGAPSHLCRGPPFTASGTWISHLLTAANNVDRASDRVTYLRRAHRTLRFGREEPQQQRRGRRNNVHVGEQTCRFRSYDAESSAVVTRPGDGQLRNFD